MEIEYNNDVLLDEKTVPLADMIGFVQMYIYHRKNVLVKIIPPRNEKEVQLLGNAFLIAKKWFNSQTKQPVNISIRMTRDELLKGITPSDKMIVVTGLFATGKTTLCAELMKLLPGFSLIHCDSYIQYPDPVTALLSFIKYECREKVIIEGAQTYRMLLDNKLRPDVVINCVASEYDRQQRYLNPERMSGNRYAGDRPGFKKDFKFMDSHYRTMWFNYIDSKPNVKIYQYET